MWVKGHERIWLDLPLMIDSAFCAGAAMITFGAILGKVSPTQLTYLLVLEVCASLLYAVTKLRWKLKRIYMPDPRGRHVGGWVGE